MIDLSYSTFGLTELNFLESIKAVDSAGYSGVELSFHRHQFNPFEFTDEYLLELRRLLGQLQVEPACVATASHFFTPSRPHEPSLLNVDKAGRKQRIDLIRRGIHVARTVGVPLVTFGSGFLREEHLSDPNVEPGALLVDSIRECLSFLRSDDDITLLLEPEPGMFIETMDQALALVDAVDSDRFALHLDLCHMYCSERDYVSALARAAPTARYIHVSDAREGRNLKIVKSTWELSMDLDFAGYLVYFPDSAEFLFVDRGNPIYFFDEGPDKRTWTEVIRLLQSVGVDAEPARVDYNTLHKGSSDIDNEVFTYLISVPGLSYEVLDRARAVVLYLRTAPVSGNTPVLDDLVANTLTGIAHFHEIPGEGTLDFEASFRALTDNGFSGYASVELYHHVSSWERALAASHEELSKYV